MNTGDERFRWRSVWVYDLKTQQVKQASNSTTNCWEANWCGNDQVVAVSSRSPSEGDWYSASLKRIDITTGTEQTLYTPKDQLGWPSASPDGKYFAVVEAVCSDRWVVAGDLLLINCKSGDVTRIYTNNVDVTYIQWRSNAQVAVAGLRSFETVFAEYNIKSKGFTEFWASQELSCGSTFYPELFCLPDSEGEYAIIGKGFLCAPELAVIRKGNYTPLASFDRGYNALITELIDSVEKITWASPDGFRIEGWLLLPTTGSKPYPLIIEIHGGPVMQYRSNCIQGKPQSLLLLKRGYAIFRPNPRGSVGRGQDFIRHVQGDMGGAW